MNNGCLRVLFILACLEGQHPFCSESGHSKSHVWDKVISCVELLKLRHKLNLGNRDGYLCLTLTGQDLFFYCFKLR